MRRMRDEVELSPEAAALAEWTDSRPDTRRRAVSFARAAVEAEEIRRSRDWDRARPRHLVALYAWLHEQIYGVPPSELEQATTMTAATAAARRLVDREFDGDVKRAVAFIRWTWARERRAEQRRRAEGVEGRRVAWELQFGRRLVTDYRVEVARRGAL